MDLGSADRGSDLQPAAFRVVTYCIPRDTSPTCDLLPQNIFKTRMCINLPPLFVAELVSPEERSPPYPVRSPRVFCPTKKDLPCRQAETTHRSNMTEQRIYLLGIEQFPHHRSPPITLDWQRQGGKCSMPNNRVICLQIRSDEQVGRQSTSVIQWDCVHPTTASVPAMPTT